MGINQGSEISASHGVSFSHGLKSGVSHDSGLSVNGMDEHSIDSTLKHEPSQGSQVPANGEAGLEVNDGKGVGFVQSWSQDTGFSTDRVNQGSVNGNHDVGSSASGAAQTGFSHKTGSNHGNRKVVIDSISSSGNKCCICQNEVRNNHDSENGHRQDTVLSFGGAKNAVNSHEFDLSLNRGINIGTSHDVGLSFNKDSQSGIKSESGVSFDHEVNHRSETEGEAKPYHHFGLEVNRGLEKTFNLESALGLIHSHSFQKNGEIKKHLG